MTLLFWEGDVNEGYKKKKADPCEIGLPEIEESGF
jgi:hypothetical protein